MASSDALQPLCVLIAAVSFKRRARLVLERNYSERTLCQPWRVDDLSFPVVLSTFCRCLLDFTTTIIQVARICSHVCSHFAHIFLQFDFVLETEHRDRDRGHLSCFASGRWGQSRGSLLWHRAVSLLLRAAITVVIVVRTRIE